LTLQTLFLPSPNEAKWKHNEERYFELWNVPNCIDAINGKHIRLKCSPISGSLYSNYTGYFSPILLACADAHALFSAVHVRDFSKNNDSSTFVASILEQMLETEELHILVPSFSTNVREWQSVPLLLCSR
jgi:hypothetical protein